VLVNADEPDYELAVTQLLAPYDENDEWGRPGSRWDWWMIGGRQTGMLDATYDPEKDPANLEPCKFCEGGITTQRIADRFPAYQPHVSQTCIQCKGTGSVSKWPSRWAAFKGDVIPARQIDMDRVRYLPTAVVTPDGKWHERVENGYGMFAAPRGPEKAEDEWGREFSALLEAHRDAIAVVVDCHV